jgi:hypothetical protein
MGRFDERIRIASVDDHGARIMITPEQLTRVFVGMSSGLRKVSEDPLLTEKHTEAVAEYVNLKTIEILEGRNKEGNYELGGASKLERMMKQLTLNTHYGLSDYDLHKLYRVNPRVSKQESIFDIESMVTQRHIPNESCGILVPHFNPQEAARLQERHKNLNQ